MERLLIQNGTIVTPDEIMRGDILIVGETIARVAPEIRADDARVIDATGLHIFPGAIDAHVHLRDPGATHKEDFTTGTRAALAGGVTTILDMPNNSTPTTTRAALAEKRAIARARAVCDFGLVIGATAENAEEINGTRTAPRADERGKNNLIRVPPRSSASNDELGAVAIKLYLGATTGDLLVTEFDPVYRHFSARNDLPIVVHAEDNDALNFFAGASRHPQKRPAIAAVLAVARVLAIAETTGRAVHIAHLSTAREIELVKDAKARGVRVTCEVAPHHLFLSTDDEERLGAFGIVNPPLRAPDDVRALWQNLAHIDLVATDHAPHTRAEKESAKPPSGMPGLETMLPLLLNAANEKRLSLSDIARMTARNPVRVFHLAHKAEIAEGFDADLTLVNLDAEFVIQKPFETKCNWSPFEGTRGRGKIARVILRGREVIADGKFFAEPGNGREVQRT
ncbi:MAG: dihydroorotase family protein [Chloroflexi bacterium]|nr:dihydroorotase family protein [Chloroflexota bacterium]